jgi:hypothetical protein
MSEYQYYEWQAIDRLLTPEEQSEVNGLSSHIDVTASNAMVDYQWGSFKHNARQVLLRYFDAHLYLANWGSRRLIFRFPQGLLDENAVNAYCVLEHISFDSFGEYQVLNLELPDEEGFGWVETHGVLSTFTRLRDDLIRGDFRLLYLAWLKAMALDPFWNEDIEVEDQIEPPVPEGLNQLTPVLSRFIDVFDLDPILVKAAAEASPKILSSQEHDYGVLVSKLSRNDCDDFLTRLANGETGVDHALRKKLMSFIRQKPTKQKEHRSIGELLRKQEEFHEAEKKRKAEAAQRTHIAKMESLAQYGPEMWAEIDRLLVSYTAKVYDEVTSQLIQLKQLANFQGTQDAVKTRMGELRVRYKTRHALMDRWDQKGL